ncbi:sensor domain-containing diguanylate cyclase [Anoxynatronum buryatiense]|uniref:Diguanylate cyclase (GGDEF) domain-containing protein n=1 Tax=Anoxynatronum buryatiense TaxID=489973 RepID=A0AA45WTH9_9CLOT|nr:sensor domain-containing diguanylate cyclase [Anoxynatronum buryatiense]SMP41036.1 diguanylate cyclase (GGDEF) domain-containing protein [Anoxynatronum buryatiense]
MYALKPMTTEDLMTLDRLMPVPFVLINLSNHLYASSLFRKLTGFSGDEITFRQSLRVIHPDHREAFFMRIVDILDHPETLESAGIESNQLIKEVCLLTPEGPFWFDYHFTLVHYQERPCILATLNDVTSKKLNQQALGRLINLREAMLEITQSVIGVECLDNIYDLVLKKAIQAIDAAEVGSIMLREGTLLKMAAHRGFKNELIDHFQLPIEESFLYKATNGKLNYIAKIDNITSLENVYAIPLENGGDRTIKSSITAPIFIEGDFFGVVDVESTRLAAFSDDDLKIMQFIRNHVEIAIANYLLYEEKRYLSQYDSLTGIYNRTFFEEIFSQVLDKAERYREMFHLVLFDLNCLKVVNDHLGHLAGDQLIQRFAAGLKRITRKSDVLARYGGDEFVGVFYYTDETHLHQKMLDFLSELEREEIIIDDTAIHNSFSYGIATYGKDGTTLQEMVRIADLRMYEFKDTYKAARPAIFSIKKDFRDEQS